MINSSIHVHTSIAEPGGRPSRLIVAAQFMVVLDMSIVNVALASIKSNLALFPGEPPVGDHAPTRSPSAASCCSAAAWPTCSAAGACS